MLSPTRRPPHVTAWFSLATVHPLPLTQGWSSRSPVCHRVSMHVDVRATPHTTKACTELTGYNERSVPADLGLGHGGTNRPYHEPHQPVAGAVSGKIISSGGKPGISYSDSKCQIIDDQMHWVQVLRSAVELNKRCIRRERSTTTKQRYPMSFLTRSLALLCARPVPAEKESMSRWHADDALGFFQTCASLSYVG